MPEQCCCPTYPREAFDGKHFHQLTRLFPQQKYLMPNCACLRLLVITATRSIVVACWRSCLSSPVELTCRSVLVSVGKTRPDCKVAGLMITNSKIIEASPEPVTLLCIGPVPNIAEALRRDPSIVDNARFVGMFGSVYKGYAGEPDVAAEWNVKADPQSLRPSLQQNGIAPSLPLIPMGLSFSTVRTTASCMTAMTPG